MSRGWPHRAARPPGWRKHVVFHAILLDGTRIRHPWSAPPGRFLLPEGLEKLLEWEADRVEAFFPGLEFRLVPLRDGNFNLVEVEVEPSSSCGREAAGPAMLGDQETGAL